MNKSQCSVLHAMYYNMIVVFFPGFYRFIPGFDRFIPGFDRFVPASIPVTGIPLQSKDLLVNKMCLFCMYIYFYFIPFEIYIFDKKKFSEQIIS